MSAAHAAEALTLRTVAAGMRALPWPASLAIGTRLGDAVRVLGIRRRVAEENLARAFPDRSLAERQDILVRHYRELGKVAAEYTRLAELARAPAGQVVAAVHGTEHFEAVRARGRGAILLSGHFGNFELLGAWLGQRHPVSFIVRPLSNPRVEAWIGEQRRRSGVEVISTRAGVRRVYEALRSNRWVAVVADQDARRHGIFVPFFGTPASTAPGPARIAIATGAPIVMGFVVRGPDGRLDLHVESPLEPEDARAPDAAERLTARHVAVLEHWIRKHPEAWFWLHRRWKTTPPATG